MVSTASSSPALMVWVAPKSRAQSSFSVVDVDGDDRRRADQGGAGDRGVTDAAAADHRDGVVAADVAGVDRRAEAGHHAAAEQAGHGRVGLGIDLGALTFVDQGLVGERADAQRRGEFGAVGQRHLLGGVEGVEAVPAGGRVCRPGTARRPRASSG